MANSTSKKHGRRRSQGTAVPRRRKKPQKAKTPTPQPEPEKTYDSESDFKVPLEDLPLPTSATTTSKKSQKLGISKDITTPATATASIPTSQQPGVQTAIAAARADRARMPLSKTSVRRRPFMWTEEESDYQDSERATSADVNEEPELRGESSAFGPASTKQHTKRKRPTSLTGRAKRAKKTVGSPTPVRNLAQDTSTSEAQPIDLIRTTATIQAEQPILPAATVQARLPIETPSLQTTAASATTDHLSTCSSPCTQQNCGSLSPTDDSSTSNLRNASDQVSRPVIENVLREETLPNQPGESSRIRPNAADIRQLEVVSGKATLSGTENNIFQSSAKLLRQAAAQTFHKVHIGPPFNVPNAIDMPADFVLIDCRNEHNGLGGAPRNGKQPELDPALKCKLCFKFRRYCDQLPGACGTCTLTNSTCTRLAPPPKPAAPEFTGSQLWEKCQKCAAFNKTCTFEGEDNNCSNCKQRGWQCKAQSGPKPKKKIPFQGRFQDKSTKCHYCLKSRSHCDQAKPKCGRCERWGYKCMPQGVDLPKMVPKDEKCRRCRQLKLRCSTTLPCPKCTRDGIECGMTAREEAAELEFFGVE